MERRETGPGGRDHTCPNPFGDRSANTPTISKGFLEYVRLWWSVGRILRYRLSDAHGQGKRLVKPAPRHADLAVNLACAVCVLSGCSPPAASPLS